MVDAMWCSVGAFGRKGTGWMGWGRMEAESLSVCVQPNGGCFSKVGSAPGACLRLSLTTRVFGPSAGRLLIAAAVLGLCELSDGNRLPWCNLPTSKR